MAKMCELSEMDRVRMVKDINTTMKNIYRIDQESINEFWQTMKIGLQAREVC